MDHRPTGESIAIKFMKAGKNIFGPLGQKTQTMELNIDKLDFIKIKNLCASNDMREVKRHLTEWEKIFAIHMTGKNLMSGPYKELLKLNNRKTNPT